MQAQQVTGGVWAVRNPSIELEMPEGDKVTALFWDAHIDRIFATDGKTVGVVKSGNGKNVTWLRHVQWPLQEPQELALPAAWKQKSVHALQGLVPTGKITALRAYANDGSVIFKKQDAPNYHTSPQGIVQKKKLLNHCPQLQVTKVEGVEGVYVAPFDTQHCSGKGCGFSWSKLSILVGQKPATHLVIDTNKTAIIGVNADGARAVWPELPVWTGIDIEKVLRQGTVEVEMISCGGTKTLYLDVGCILTAAEGQPFEMTEEITEKSTTLTVDNLVRLAKGEHKEWNRKQVLLLLCVALAIALGGRILWNRRAAA